MNKKEKCLIIQSQMADYFGNQPERLPDDLAEHLKTCSDCKIEFDALSATLDQVKSIELTEEVVPDHLLSSIENQLDSTEQIRVFDPNFVWARNKLMLQYAYLAGLAVTIWVSLLIGQPMFINWLTAQGLMINHQIFLDYGLFITFFGIGGFAALLSTPLLLGNNKKLDPPAKKNGFFKRFFSGNLRLFACW
jgi:hypothetical protein